MQFLDFLSRPEIVSLIAAGLGYVFHSQKKATKAALERWTLAAFRMVIVARGGAVDDADVMSGERRAAFCQDVLTVTRDLARKAGIKNVPAAAQLRILAMAEELLASERYAARKAA